MKERPILMSAPMVRAILEGRKTQTRRPIKFRRVSNPHSTLSVQGCVFSMGDLAREAKMLADGTIKPNLPCPYGATGDRLWVRETHFRYGHWVRNGVSEGGRQAWTFKAVNRDIIFLTGDHKPDALPPHDKDRTVNGWWKRPGIFLPHWASRILLEITEVRVQRVQDISEEDALAEGIEPATPFEAMKWGHKYGSDYVRLWDSINGKRYPWESNPWVWCIAFKRLPRLEEGR